MKATNLSLSKRQARLRARRVRASISDKNVAAKLASHWPNERFQGKSVAGFWPIKDEIDPRLLLKDLLDKGNTIALPAIVKPDHPLEFRQWKPTMQLVDGPFKTLEPPPEAPKIFPDVVFVPLLAFNLQGDRLGYGGGFYDRTLARLRSMKRVFACGIAFSAQETPHIPTDEFDQKLNGILTENYFRKF
jgi:5-formyltetrahydrofolate cyclo-ligase